MYELKLSGFGTAVISCGEDNSYGHPHREILSYLKKSKAKVFRTDKQGTIKFTCDASGFTVTTEK